MPTCAATPEIARTLLMLAVGLALVAPGYIAARPATGPRAPAPRVSAPALSETAGYPRQAVLGLCEDYPEESRTLAAARADLERVRDSGGTVLRIAFGWDAMEPARGRYDWSFWDEFVPLAVETYGLRLIPYVCYTPDWAASVDGPEDFWRSPPRDPHDFERFVAALSARYARWIDSWELWNEPDNAAYWTGDAAQFAELVRAGSRGVKRGDPGATIVLGGIATRLDFLEELLADQQLAPAIDVVNLHSYFETWHPDPIESLPAYISEAAELVKRHGEGEPLWMAEVGYSTRSGDAQISSVYRAHYLEEHTPPYQAAALARTLLLCLGTGQLPLLAWYRVNDLPPAEDVIGDDNNRHLGLFDAQGRPKPAYAAFQWFVQQFRQPYRVLDTWAEFRSDPELPVETRTFSFPHGRVLVGVWLPSPARPATTPAAPDHRATTVRLLPPPGSRLSERVRLPATEPSEEDVTAPTTFALRGGEVVLLLFDTAPAPTDNESSLPPSRHRLSRTFAEGTTNGRE